MADHAEDILGYFAGTEESSMVILAPNTPPVYRGGEGISVPLSAALSAADVEDVLAAFQVKAGTPGIELSRSGTFSFGMKDIGRFRVSYAMQRGSRAVTVCRIPHAIPEWSSVSEDPDAVDRLYRLIVGRQGGILALFGPNAASNSVLVYALLQKLNQEEKRVVCIVEQSLSYLLRHDRCLVIQIDLNTDVETFDEGVRNAFFFEPDVLFVGDVRPGEEVPGVRRAADIGIVTIITGVTLNGRLLLETCFLWPDADEPARPQPCLIARVTPAPRGRVSIELIDESPGGTPRGTATGHGTADVRDKKGG